MTHITIKFGESKFSAFRRGFMKGFGAPDSLFGEFSADPAISNFKPMPLPQRHRSSVADDWQQAGNFLRQAIAQRG